MFSFKITVTDEHLFLFLPVCYDSLFSEYPRLPDMLQIGTQIQNAAAMEVSKGTGSTKKCLDSNQPN